MSSNNSKEKSGAGVVKMFFYLAPLIGIVFGVIYLQKNRINDQITISKDRLEVILKQVIQEIDQGNCLDTSRVNREVTHLIDRLK